MLLPESDVYPLCLLTSLQETDSNSDIVRQTPRHRLPSLHPHPSPANMRHLCASLTLLLAMFAIALSAPDAGEEGTGGPARLLVEKRILNKYLVEGKDIVVNYHLYNVGKATATAITVTDNSLAPEYFDTVSGAGNFAVARLNPGENVSHTVVYRSKIGVWGRFNFTSALISYLPSPDAKATQVCPCNRE